MVRKREIKVGVTSIRLDDGTLQCKKCGRLLARLEDGVLRAGGIHIWNEARFSCAACGKVYCYGEKVAERLPKDETVTYDTLHELGRDFQRESIERRERRRAS
jgi:phage FluMu protein Com